MGSGTTGVQDIKDHIFFQGIDWIKVEKKLTDPIYKPEIPDKPDLKRAQSVPIHKVETEQKETKSTIITGFDENSSTIEKNASIFNYS